MKNVSYNDILLKLLSSQEMKKEKLSVERHFRSLDDVYEVASHLDEERDFPAMVYYLFPIAGYVYSELIRRMLRKDSVRTAEEDLVYMISKAVFLDMTFTGDLVDAFMASGGGNNDYDTILNNEFFLMSFTKRLIYLHKKHEGRIPSLDEEELDKMKKLVVDWLTRPAKKVYDECRSTDDVVLRFFRGMMKCVAYMIYSPYEEDVAIDASDEPGFMVVLDVIIKHLVSFDDEDPIYRMFIEGVFSDEDTSYEKELHDVLVSASSTLKILTKKLLSRFGNKTDDRSTSFLDFDSYFINKLIFAVGVDFTSRYKDITNRREDTIKGIYDDIVIALDIYHRDVSLVAGSTSMIDMMPQITSFIKALMRVRDAMVDIIADFIIDIIRDLHAFVPTDRCIVTCYSHFEDADTFYDVLNMLQNRCILYDRENIKDALHAINDLCGHDSKMFVFPILSIAYIPMYKYFKVKYTIDSNYLLNYYFGVNDVGELEDSNILPTTVTTAVPMFSSIISDVRFDCVSASDIINNDKHESQMNDDASGKDNVILINGEAYPVDVFESMTETKVDKFIENLRIEKFLFKYLLKEVGDEAVDNTGNK